MKKSESKKPDDILEIISSAIKGDLIIGSADYTNTKEFKSQSQQLKSLKMDQKELETLIANFKSYFDVDLIGSYIFVKYGFLTIEDVSDIDLAVSSERKLNFYKFLSDNGFAEDKHKEYAYRSSAYTMKPTGRFRKEGCIDFHILEKSKDFAVFSIEKLICEKITRGYASDNEMVMKVLQKKTPNKSNEYQS